MNIMIEALKKAGLATDEDADRVAEEVIRDCARAEAALEEVKVVGQELHLARELEACRARDLAETREKLADYKKQGVRYGLIDNVKHHVCARERELNKAAAKTLAAEQRMKTVHDSLTDLARTM